VPARNEQACLGECLESLVVQQGIDFKIIVVDDRSTDDTRAIAGSYPNVLVLTASEPAQGIMGKCNAIMTATGHTRAKWLLFTDADTMHREGSLAAAVAEAERRSVDLLSYSPEQLTESWSENILMPLVYAELAKTYSMDRVNDPQDATAAANGQYILARREAYEALGGHVAIAKELLEDVALARLFKSSGRKIWFGSGAGLVATRMYRDFRSLVEGWTKNLVLLFKNPLRLGLIRLAEFILVVLGLAGGVGAAKTGNWAVAFPLLALSTAIYLAFVYRMRKANFSWKATAAAFWGLPLFTLLLVRSWLHYRVRGSVTWKGRRYIHSEPSSNVQTSIQKGNITAKG